MNIEQNLRHGYFPAEVPTAFTTKDFALAAKSLKSVPSKLPWTACTPLNLARPGGTLRRRLGLPNPFSQLKLVEVCAANWPTLDSHLQRSTISLSRPVADPKGYLRLRVPYPDRAAERLTRMHRARYTLVADISNFYGSIYTHSVEWALHTKAAAKAGLKVKGAPKLLGGLLDEAARSATEGQTKGIPIGPKTSLILSELILCAIDEQMQAKHSATSRFAIRMIDDLEFSSVSRAEAEDVLFTWDGLLSAYELDLNPLKTQILDGPIAPDAAWKTALQQFQLRTTSTDRILANDIRGIFSRAFELATAADPGEAVLTYAVSRVNALPLGSESWNVFSHLLLAAATAEPSSLRRTHAALMEAQKSGRKIDATLLSDSLSGICYYHAPLEHGSEVAWSLCILRDLGIPVSSEAALRVSAMQDNCSLLLLLDMIKSGLITGPAPSTAAIEQRAEDGEAHKSEDWLLAYECVRLGWASDKHFKAEGHWKELLSGDVAFFKALSPKAPSTAPGSTLTPGTHAAGVDITDVAVGTTEEADDKELVASGAKSTDSGSSDGIGADGEKVPQTESPSSVEDEKEPSILNAANETQDHTGETANKDTTSDEEADRRQDDDSKATEDDDAEEDHAPDDSSGYS